MWRQEKIIRRWIQRPPDTKTGRITAQTYRPRLPALILRPHDLPLFSRINIEYLTRNPPTPRLASQIHNTLRHISRRNGFPQRHRSLRVQPVLLRILLALFLELRRINRPRRHCIDARARVDPHDVILQALHQTDLHRALAAGVVSVGALAEPAALAADDDETEIAGLGCGMRFDLAQPGPRGEEGAFDVHSEGAAPLLSGHIDEGDVREDAEVEAGKRDAALDDAELEAGFLEGGIEFRLGRDVGFHDVKAFVGEGELGGVDVESGYFGAGSEESGDCSRPDEARAAGDDDVTIGETEVEACGVHCCKQR